MYSVMGNPAYDMPGTHPDTIDGSDPAQIREVCSGADIIYLCMNAHYVDWYGKFPPVLDATLDAAAAAGARLIYADNVHMYGPVPGPLTEDLPNTERTRKGKLCGELADKVLRAHIDGKLQTIIGRASDMYGPGALNSSFGSTLGQRHFYPALAGNAVGILGDGDVPHSYIFVDDFASGLITLAEHSDALGQVWHIPAAPTISHREILNLVFKDTGYPPRIRSSRISGYFVRLIGLFQKDVAELAETLYQFEKPHVVDHGKVEAACGATPTPHLEALKITLDWYRKNPP